MNFSLKVTAIKHIHSTGRLDRFNQTIGHVEFLAEGKYSNLIA